MSLASAVVLLQTALSLLVLVNSNPSLPQSMRDTAQQVAQQAIAQATEALGSNTASSAASTQSAPSTTAATDYSSYAPVTLALYAANPPAYFGKPISVTGMLNAFMPKGGSGGSTNYLELINPFDQSQPKFMAEVDSATAYADAVSSL